MTNEEIESCIQSLRFLENTFLDDHGIFLNDKHPDNIEKIITFLHKSPCEDGRIRIRGTWLNNGMQLYCSNCKRGNNEYRSFPFCPYCGADMRESQVRDRK